LRLQTAEYLARELPFSLLTDGEGRPDALGGTVLQGQIDVLLRDAQGWLVLDFKTDHIRAEAAQSAAAAYRPQLEAYRAAVRAVVGVEHVAARIYFLTPGVEVELEA